MRYADRFTHPAKLFESSTRRENEFAEEEIRFKDSIINDVIVAIPYFFAPPRLCVRFLPQQTDAGNSHRATPLRMNRVVDQSER